MEVTILPTPMLSYLRTCLPACLGIPFSHTNYIISHHQSKIFVLQGKKLTKESPVLLCEIINSWKLLFYFVCCTTLQSLLEYSLQKTHKVIKFGPSKLSNWSKKEHPKTQKFKNSTTHTLWVANGCL